MFTIGVGIHDRIAERPDDWPSLIAEFSAVTPENCLKPDPVQVVEGKFNFSRADAFVGFAKSNGLQVIGHCLVWAKDDRTPSWFFRDGTNAAGRDLLLARMKGHIDDVAGRYRGDEAARHYAQIRRQFETQGAVIGPNDLKIAAIARAKGLTVVSSGQEFTRVAGLRVEDWSRS